MAAHASVPPCASMLEQLKLLSNTVSAAIKFDLTMTIAMLRDKPNSDESKLATIVRIPCLHVALVQSKSVEERMCCSHSLGNDALLLWTAFQLSSFVSHAPMRYIDETDQLATLELLDAWTYTLLSDREDKTFKDVLNAATMFIEGTTPVKTKTLLAMGKRLKTAASILEEGAALPYAPDHSTIIGSIHDAAAAFQHTVFPGTNDESKSHDAISMPDWDDVFASHPKAHHACTFQATVWYLCHDILQLDDVTKLRSMLPLLACAFEALQEWNRRLDKPRKLEWTSLCTPQLATLMQSWRHPDGTKSSLAKRVMVCFTTHAKSKACPPALLSRLSTLVDPPCCMHAPHE